MKKMRITLSVFLILILCALIFNAYSSSQPVIMTQKFVEFFDLPAASVNGKVIGFKQLYNELNAATRFSADETTGTLDDVQLLSIVWAKIIDEVIIRYMARDYKISVTIADVDSYTDEILTKTPDSSEADVKFSHFFKKSYLRIHVVEPLLLRDLINKYLIVNSESDARNAIQSIYQEMFTNPKKFESVSEKYSKDRGLPVNNTEIILTPSDLPTETVLIFDSLHIGDITPIIAGHDGYRIYKVLNIFTDPEKAWQLKEFFVPSNILQIKLAEYKAKLQIKFFAHLFEKIK